MIEAVLDASVAIAVILNEQDQRNDVDRILYAIANKTLAVPPNWPYEIGNAYRKALRQYRITLQEENALKHAILSFSCVIDTLDPEYVISYVVPIALQNDLSVYDAAYLELAIRERVPLATVDRDLREKALKLGISCL